MGNLLVSNKDQKADKANDSQASERDVTLEVKLDAAPEALRGTKIIPFRSLCRCGDEVWIENDGAIYRLRRTRLGKLILTK